MDYGKAIGPTRGRGVCVVVRASFLFGTELYE